LSIHHQDPIRSDQQPYGAASGVLMDRIDVWRPGEQVESRRQLPSLDLDLSEGTLCASEKLGLQESWQIRAAARPKRLRFVMWRVFDGVTRIFNRVSS
jgi:hypothetical protein